MTQLISQDTKIEQQAEATTKAFEDAVPLALSEGFKIQDLEPYMPHRRSYRMRFSTKSIAAWCKYCKTEAADLPEGMPVVAFVDRDRSSATAVFDLGTPAAPLHGEWRASVTVDKTPEYTEFLRGTDQRLSQRDLCEWVEEWADSITFLDSAGKDIARSKAFNALRTVTIKAKKDSESRVGDHSANRSTMETIEAASRENALPSFLVMTAPPHLEFEPRAFIARIGLLTGEESPRFILRPQRLEKTRDEIAEEFVAKIEAGTTGSGIRVEIGTADY